MKSLFGDLDQLIEQAVASATNTEKSIQKKQASAVEERGLTAKEADEKKKEVEEAEDEEKNEKPDDESVKKIKGKESGSDKSGKEKKDEEIPGTKTSKKLNDPPEKVISNPGFDDIKNKVNALRGSGSLANEKVKDSVKSYLDGLSSAEKSALLTYLTNLAQIMSTVKTPKDVQDPSKVGIKISFSGNQKSDSKKTSFVPENEPNKDKVIVVGGK